MAERITGLFLTMARSGVLRSMCCPSCSVRFIHELLRGLEYYAPMWRAVTIGSIHRLGQSIARHQNFRLAREAGIWERSSSSKNSSCL